MSDYKYNIYDDFPNHKVDLGSLELEINDSSIIAPLDYINSNPISVDIFFDAAGISSSDKAILDNIVANHQGIKIPDAVEIYGDAKIDGALYIKDVSAGGPFTYMAIDASNMMVDSGIEANYYGSQFHLFQSLGRSTTSAKTPQTKATLITKDLPIGKYRIEISWLAKHTSSANDMKFDVQLNGVSHGIENTLQMESKDPTTIFPFKRVFFPDLGGINEIKLRYWNENSSTTISDVTIELIRVL